MNLTGETERKIVIEGEIARARRRRRRRCGVNFYQYLASTFFDSVRKKDVRMLEIEATKPSGYRIL